MKHWAVRLFLFVATSRLFAAEGTETIPWRQDQPPNPPCTPQEALGKMTMPDGFEVELVASEPDVVNPIAMTFDDRGRIWITESLEYPRKPAGAGRDRVKILEDTDRDGRADKMSIFADGLNIPTGLAIGYGGVWVLNAPDLLFLREKDGKEASREVVLTGFGRTDTHELPNSLTWGPDGWLYGLNGVFNQCRVQSNNGREYKFNCALWRVHPRTREFQIVSEGTSNPYGLAWDAEGSAIVEACHWANDHLFHFVETGHYQRQAGAFPPFTIPIGSITDHGHQKTAYCGLAFLDTDAYPPQFRGRIVVGNIHGGAINVDQLQRDGATYLAKGEADLLNGNDAWFMPVALKIGPDGCLYVLDWYDRYHCSQDAARDPAGVDRLKGRLYRLRYKDSPRAPKLDLATESDDQLIARLASGNIYFREAAQRILTERLGSRSRELRGTLEELVLTGTPPTPSMRKNRSAELTLGAAQAPDRAEQELGAPSRRRRLHALWAMIGSGTLELEFHLKVLADSDPACRAWGVRAAGNFGDVSSAIQKKVAALAHDPSPDVQLQVAIASRKINGFDALPVLSELLAHCGHDKIIPSIVWNNLHPLLEMESMRFVSLQSDWSPALATLSPKIVERMLSAKEPRGAAVATFTKFVADRDGERAKECLSAISARLGALNEPVLAQLKTDLKLVLQGFLARQADAPFLFSAQLLAARLGLAEVDSTAVRTRFTSTAEPEATRLQALDALVAFRDPQLLAALPGVLSSASPQFVRRAYAVLGRVEDPKLADVLLAEYAKLAPELQPLAVDLILQRERWARKLLDAVLANKLPKGVLHANHLRKILESNDREALWAVEKAFGRIREERNPEREKVVSEMATYLRDHAGDPHRGQIVFRNLCAQCHAIHGEGGAVGPDLTANGRSTFEQLLSNVFDPSLVIGPAYQVTTVVTKDGRNLTGLISEDNEQRIMVRMPGEGEETVPRNNVKYTRVSKLSMMPEGLEASLDKKDLSDLFAFLALDKPPSDPTARLIPGAPAGRPSMALVGEPTVKTYTFKTLDLQSNLLQADVHRPPGDVIRPAIVFIHGGALMMGGRAMSPKPGTLLKALLDAGYVVVSIDYRLAPQVKLPAILEDVRDACAWVRQRGPELFRSDPDEMFVMGQSAGGYLTMMAGLRVEPRPRALVSFWGYGDIAGPWYSQPDAFYRRQPLVTKEEADKSGGMKLYLYCRQQGLWPNVLTGHDPQKEPRAFDPFCPVRNVTRDFPPTLLIHGTKDTDVPYELSIQMDKELSAKGVSHELITIPNGGHGFGKGEAEIAARTYQKVVEFLNKYRKR